MYDSRSSHARNGHHARSNREHGWADQIEWSTPRSRQMCTPEAKRAAIDEGIQEQVQIIAEIAEEESAWLIDCEAVEVSRWVLNDAHAEALEYNALAPWERELLLPWTDKDGNRHEGYAADEFDTMWEGEVLPAYSSAFDVEAIEDAAYDNAYGGYSDDPDYGDYEGCWLPFMRIEELRDTFGENWLGNGFHIIEGNAIRRSK